jgi:diguanylate cyclase (GGDEF)-like protein/PAS domain S-box-containing protein
MENHSQIIAEYIRSLLYDAKIQEDMPDELLEIEGMKEIDSTLRELRKSIRAVGIGELSEKIEGKGYVFGILKDLQAALKTLNWQTKAISAGDFSQRVEFLGEFSDAFNDMVVKLETAILEVKEARDLFEMFFETIPEATMIVSAKNWNILDCNRAFEKMTGYTKKELYDKNIQEISFFRDSIQEDIFFETIGENTKANNILIELLVQDGSLIYGLFSSDTILIEKEKHILFVIKDITEMKNLEQKLKDSEEIHRLLVDNANDVIWTMNLLGEFTYISPSVEKLRGYTVDEVLNQSNEELLCPDSLIFFEEGIKTAINCVENDLPFKIFREDVEQPCKDGSTVMTDLTVSGIYDKESRFVGILGVSRDITDRRRMEEEIRKLSETDRLTQLNNRLKLDSVLKHEIERLARSDSACSVIILDIDFFKKVNDTYGHLVGDEVLKEFAMIIKSNVRKIDTIGRWGGEEFMVIMPFTEIDGGKVLAEKLRSKIVQHNFAGAGNLTASFGVAESRGDLSAVELVAKADSAMYKAKHAGRNRVCHSD